jgi:hypothetical protein
MPYRFRTHNNNPSGSRQIKEPSLKATAHASGITVLRDDVEASVLKLELAEGEVEYIVFNPEGLEMNIGKRTTSQQFAYWSSKSR